MKTHRGKISFTHNIRDLFTSTVTASIQLCHCCLAVDCSSHCYGDETLSHHWYMSWTGRRVTDSTPSVAVFCYSLRNSSAYSDASFIVIGEPRVSFIAEDYSFLVNNIRQYIRTNRSHELMALIVFRYMFGIAWYTRDSVMSSILFHIVFRIVCAPCCNPPWSDVFLVSLA